MAVVAVTLLETRDLTRTFGGLEAVAGVDLDVQKGEVRALIGPNGAGKTTLVNLISGRLSPSSGTIHFAGEDITRLGSHTRVQRGIVYTFQITSIFKPLTVLDNVALAAQRTLVPPGSIWPRIDPAAIDAASRAALAKVGLADRANETASSLSYGHQRLLEIAMGLALAPRLLILDEPTQGLADTEIASFCALVRSLAADSTILLIEHNMGVVMRLADRITVMASGRVLADGAPAAIRADDAVRKAYLGT